MTDEERALEWFKNRRTAITMKGTREMYDIAIRVLQERVIRSVAGKDFEAWERAEADAIDIGDRIKNRLDEIGMSQRELADKCKLTEVSMSRYINGTRTPKAPMVCIMAKALYTTPNSLLGWEEEQNG